MSEKAALDRLTDHAKHAGSGSQLSAPRPSPAKSRRLASSPETLPQALAALRERLESRRAEIEQGVLTRVYGIADPTEIGDLSYVEGFRNAAAAAVEFGLATIESSQDRLPLVPPVLLSQARLAARNDVGLDTVLRRYTAGHALLVDFLIDEAEHEEIWAAADLRRLLALSSSAFDRLLAAVSEEYARELENQKVFSQERRRAERVKRLLAGEFTDTTQFSYELTGWHVGLVAQGIDASDVIRAISKKLSFQVLTVANPDGLTWAWLGTRRRPDPGQVVCSFDHEGEIVVGIGEAGEGLTGWRFSHRQAAAAFSTVRSRPKAAVRYADVALLTSAKADGLLSTSLRMLILAPLDAERDEGKTARETLRAYFRAERNVTSAAAILGVKRHTVTKRLRSIEERLGKPLAKFSAEIEVALRLDAHDPRP